LARVFVGQRFRLPAEFFTFSPILPSEAIFLAECLLMSKDIKKQSVNTGKTRRREL
jgi:hypothetical protein